MPRFSPGQSGNPSGRPKSAAGLRALLAQKYGADARALVDRLEAMSAGRNPRYALQATQLLLAYACGKPEQAVALSGQIEHGRWLATPQEVLSRLSGDDLDVLMKVNRLAAPADGDD